MLQSQNILYLNHYLIFAALVWLRNKIDVSEELEEMRIEGERQRKSKKVRHLYNGSTLLTNDNLYCSHVSIM